MINSPSGPSLLLPKEAEVGKRVDKWDLFKKTHTVKGIDKWMDGRSQKIVDQVRELKEASSSQVFTEGAFTPKLDESSLLLTALGGRNKKGRLYGLGSYGKTIESSSLKGSLSYNFDRLGLQEENEKLKKKMEDQERKMKTYDDKINTLHESHSAPKL